MQDIFFPEPEIHNPSYARPTEGTLSWLRRSTLQLAKDCRHFLNFNLNELPSDYATRLHRRLLEDGQHWRSAFFEMVVARTLQALGGRVEPEPEIQGSSRPDFRAHFGSQTLIVEATCPSFRADFDRAMGNSDVLREIIEDATPEGWHVWIHKIPQLGPTESKKEFKQKVRQLLDVPPPNEGEQPKLLVDRIGTAWIELKLLPTDIKSRGISGGGPQTVFWGDQVEAIKKRVSRKRPQVRSTDLPVILAINGSEIHTFWDDFDRALLGEMKRPGHFVTDGVLSPIGSSDPTFAGVLVYLEAGFLCAHQPVLYLHPRFEGSLPSSFSRFERRSLKPDQSNIICLPPDSDSSVLEALRPVTTQFDPTARFRSDVPGEST